MFCTNCGANLDEGVKFCTNCGSPVNAVNEPETPVQQMPEETAGEVVSDAVTETPSAENAADSAAAGAGAAVFGAQSTEPVHEPAPQGTYYDHTYQMSQSQVNEGNYNYQQQQNAGSADTGESLLNPSFGEAITSFFKKYVDFSSRSTRAEYWYIVLMNVIVSAAFTFITRRLSFFGTFQTLYSLAILVPTLAVCIRRLHDIGKSGWNLLWLLLPIIGWIILIVYYCKESDGDNIYGPAPKRK